MRTPTRLAGGIALALALLSAAVLLLSGPGYRFGALPLRTAFTLLRWGAFGGIAASTVAAAVLWHKRGRDLFAMLALVLGLACVAVPLRFQLMASSSPPIHDISTDTANPPTFDAVLPRRADATNTLEYSQETARLQREAYPDLSPLILELPAPQAFARALAAAREAGWEIADANADTGRIEATATTTFFGFKDDVAIRVSPLDGRSVVDVRSVSRVGRGDAGTNARRIRDYLAQVSR